MTYEREQLETAAPRLTRPGGQGEAMTTNEQEAKRWNKAGAKDVTPESVAASRKLAEEIRRRQGCGAPCESACTCVEEETRRDKAWSKGVTYESRL